MAKGKIYHWKHGWIPLDAFARAQLVKRHGLSLTVDEKRVELNKRRAARGQPPLLPRKSTAKKGPTVTFETVPTTRRTRTPDEIANAHPADIVNTTKKPRTRKPPNWVPPKDNVPTRKPLTAAERKKIIDAELKKSPATIRAEEQKAADTALLRKNFSDMNSAEKIRAAEIMYGKDSPKINELRWRLNAEARAKERSRADAYRKLDVVDGVEFISYKSAAMDPIGDDHGKPWEMDEAQKQVVADAYNEVKAEFPGMQTVQIVAVQGKEGILGITTWDGRRISMSKNAFDDASRAIAARNFGKHGAIAGQFTDDPEAFARAVVVHEMGHALEMQTAEAKRRGDKLALEKVTRKGVGESPSVMELVNDRPELTPRWMIDTLNKQTVYGLGNQFEWFAEAFAEGWFNGDNATPSGKKAVAILKDVYGPPKKLGRIPIPKAGNHVEKGVVS